MREKVMQGQTLLFQSTPPARGATAFDELTHFTQEISIHAPREGGDNVQYLGLQHLQLFQSTPPARGATHLPPKRKPDLQFQSTPPARGATCRWTAGICSDIFQSTPPARGATRRVCASAAEKSNFNPRPPRGGRRSYLRPAAVCLHISIHAPREGGDRTRSREQRRGAKFQSTPPARGATSNAFCHSSDCSHFNPRPPRGGRPLSLLTS